ncbi:MAG: AI-2E family transporter, partial [Muribaculaceae bacterium]|nr:AI-2E family transporter [Muribaculaceae bacterium]
MENETRKYDFDRVVRIIFTAICIVAAVFVLDYLSGVLLPFLIGCLLAYILEPSVEWIQRRLKLKKRLVPVIISFVMFFGVLGLVLWLLVPYLSLEFKHMASLLAKYAKASLEVPYIPDSLLNVIRQHTNVDSITNMLSMDQWANVLNRVAQSTWSIVGGTVSIILTLASSLIILLYMFFVMLDYDKIKRGFKGAIPSQYRRTALGVFNDVTTTMSRYFRGQAMVSLLVGITFAIEFYIIGLPLAIVFGLFIGVLNMVPYLQLTSIPIAAFLCLVASVAGGGSFWALFGWTILAYCICQVIQDLVYVPAIMKQQMGLNPAIIFLSLS